MRKLLTSFFIAILVISGIINKSDAYTMIEGAIVNGVVSKIIISRADLNKDGKIDTLDAQTFDGLYKMGQTDRLDIDGNGVFSHKDDRAALASLIQTYATTCLRSGALTGFNLATLKGSGTGIMHFDRCAETVRFRAEGTYSNATKTWKISAMGESKVSPFGQYHTVTGNPVNVVEEVYDPSGKLLAKRNRTVTADNSMLLGATSGRANIKMTSETVNGYTFDPILIVLTFALK